MEEEAAKDKGSDSFFTMGGATGGGHSAAANFSRTVLVFGSQDCASIGSVHY